MSIEWRGRFPWLVALMQLAVLPAVAALCTELAAQAHNAVPTGDNFGFWSPTEQELAYRSMERIFPTHPIRRGVRLDRLPYESDGELPVSFEFEHRPYGITDFMSLERASGVLVVQDGKILLERYGLGRRPKDRWASFSIANSVLSTLVGAAIQDGYIASVHDPVTKYLPSLKGRALNGVTIEQLLTMSSGLQWNEGYDNPNSDFNRYATDLSDEFLQLMADRRHTSPPGKKFAYSTADANLVGAVVMAATRKPLSQYLSEKVWGPSGMEQDGVWITSRDGQDLGSIGFSATLRDTARLGLFMLSDGVIHGRRVLPAGWMAEATQEHIVSSLRPFGYGYFWWTRGAGAYEAIGIFGQALYIDPPRHLVIVVQSAWSNAGDAHNYALQTAFFEGVTRSVDARRSRMGTSGQRQAGR